MPSPRIGLVLPLVAAALAVTGCIGVDAGPTTSEARDVDAFTRLKAEDEVDVNLRVGEPRQLRVRAGENVIDDVRTEVRDGTLYVSYDGPSIREGRLLVQVAVPAVDAIAITGASDVRVDGVAADALEVRVSGAGDADVYASERLDAEVSGAGDLAYRGEPSLHKRISGSGEIEHAG